MVKGPGFYLKSWPEDLCPSRWSELLRSLVLGLVGYAECPPKGPHLNSSLSKLGSHLCSSKPELGAHLWEALLNLHGTELTNTLFLLPEHFTRTSAPSLQHPAL